MPRTIPFHLDENGDPRIAAGLRLHGVDITTTADAGLLQAADDAQLAYATGRGRVMVTQDADFLRLVATGQENTGIVFYRGDRRSIGQVIRQPLLIWEVYEPEEMRNRVEFL